MVLSQLACIQYRVLTKRSSTGETLVFNHFFKRIITDIFSLLNNNERIIDNFLSNIPQSIATVNQWLLGFKKWERKKNLVSSTLFLYERN